MEFRGECGRCQRPLNEDGPAYQCANECTFCATCFRKLTYVCPNCSGELVRRPRRSRSPAPAQETPPAPDDRIKIRRATIEDLDVVAPLFDAYRQFYEQPTDLERSRRFLSDRLARDESVVLVAEDGDVVVGFAQLYPLFSSVSLGPTYLLNDLFVDPSVRRKGVGAKLLEASRSHADKEGCHYLELATAVDNPAQRLYEACGWRLDRGFLHYDLPLGAEP